KTALASTVVSPKARLTAARAGRQESLASQLGKAPARPEALADERRRAAGGAARRVSACQLEPARQGRARHALRRRRRIHRRRSPVGHRAAVPTGTRGGELAVSCGLFRGGSALRCAARRRVPGRRPESRLSADARHRAAPGRDRQRRADRGTAVRSGLCRRRAGIGGGGVGSYTLALWAMTRAPVAAVAAVRETSIVFGAALGAIVLRERVTRVRALAAVAIALGVWVIRAH